MKGQQMTEQERADHIKALLRERAQAEAAGRVDVVAAINEQLRVYGHEGKPPAKRAVRR